MLTKAGKSADTVLETVQSWATTLETTIGAEMAHAAALAIVTREPVTAETLIDVLGGKSDGDGDPAESLGLWRRNEEKSGTRRAAAHSVLAA